MRSYRDKRSWLLFIALVGLTACGTPAGGTTGSSTTGFPFGSLAAGGSGTPTSATSNSSSRNTSSVGSGGSASAAVSTSTSAAATGNGNSAGNGNAAATTGSPTTGSTSAAGGTTGSTGAAVTTSSSGSSSGAAICAPCTSSSQCQGGCCDDGSGICNATTGFCDSPDLCVSATDCGGFSCDASNGICICPQTVTSSSSGSTGASAAATAASSSSGTGAAGSSGSSSSSSGSSCAAYAAPCGTGCCAGLVCDTSNGDCVVAAGQPCRGEECAPGLHCDADAGLCSDACLPFGQYCGQGESPCCGAYVCDRNDVCALAPGSPCDAGQLCVSQEEQDNNLYNESCFQGVCLAPEGQACTDAGQCLSSYCDQYCYQATGGQPCTSDWSCGENSECDNGTCYWPDLSQAPCQESGLTYQCIPGESCVGVCSCVNTGTSCQYMDPRNCCTGLCSDAGVCDDCRDSGQPCTEDANCCSFGSIPSMCSNGTCQ